MWLGRFNYKVNIDFTSTDFILKYSLQTSILKDTIYFWKIFNLN